MIRVSWFEIVFLSFIQNPTCRAFIFAISNMYSQASALPAIEFSFLQMASVIVNEVKKVRAGDYSNLFTIIDSLLSYPI